jgi:hypothetical protein
MTREILWAKHARTDHKYNAAVVNEIKTAMKLLINLAPSCYPVGFQTVSHMTSPSLRGK